MSLFCFLLSWGLLPLDFPAISRFADQHTCSYQEPRPTDQLGTALLQPTNIPSGFLSNLQGKRLQKNKQNLVAGRK